MTDFPSCGCFLLVFYMLVMLHPFKNRQNLQVSLLEETITPRKNLPPLLVHLRDRLPERIHYIGASFGLGADLFRFWKKQKFYPFYISNHPVNIFRVLYNLA